MKADKVILADGCVYSMDSQATQLNNNVIVCGSSGSGKTRSVSEPRILETENSSLIITLTKRKLAEKYKGLFQKRNYNVWELNFVDPEQSNVAYDPLAYVESEQDITHLAEAIVSADPRKKNSKGDLYWDQAAVSLLSAIIGYTWELGKNACKTFGDDWHSFVTLADALSYYDTLEINDYSGGLVETTLDDDFAYLAKKQPKCFAVSCWKTFKQLPVKTAACVFSTLNTTIDTIFTPDIRSMIAKHQKIDLEKLASERTVLFVETSAVNPSLNSFVNLFYSQVFKTLFEFAERRADGTLPVPVHVLCDDFATGGTILNFPEYISIFREKGISVTLLLQSESQLEGIYGANNATTIINNCDTYLYMGGMDLKTALSVSQRLNKPLEDVLYMPLGDVVLFRRGQRPIEARRYDIRENPLYQQVNNEYEKRVARMERR